MSNFIDLTGQRFGLLFVLGLSHKNKFSQALWHCSCDCGNETIVHSNNLRIRKLTPKECFRLMGFDDSDFEKAEAVNSNTQLYKQAGNSIGVPVVEHIIKALLECGALEIKKENTKWN